MKLLRIMSLLMGTMFVLSSKVIRNSRINVNLKGLFSTNLLNYENPTIKNVYEQAITLFINNNILEPEPSARYLLCNITNIGYKQSDFVKNINMELNNEQLNIFNEFCKMRLNNKPIQYIIGNWDFYGMTFYCNPPVLIPRPETEELVDNIINSKILNHIKNPTILDIGSGTGAIGLSLLSNYKNANCISIDVNPIAVELSNNNAKYISDQISNNLCNRYQCKLISFLDFSNLRKYFNKFDIIISNPPYISTYDMSSLDPDVREHEDKVALHGGIDGLDVVRDIINLSSNLLNPNGTNEIWLEVSREHPNIIKDWIDSALISDLRYKFQYVETINDLTRYPRFVRLKLKKQ